MGRSDRELLRIGVERGYLEAEVAARVRREAERRGRPVESLLLERRLLSARRIRRLRVHVRYRHMRKADKRYAVLAISEGLVSEAQARAGLRHQRRVFERERTCVRLGSVLIDRGLLDVEQDRALRSKLGGRRVPSEAVRKVEGDTPSSAATLALHEQSMGPRVTASSYAQIEEAVRRVEALRAMAQDLSCSDNVGADADSANEIENALAVLARRRLGAADADAPPSPAQRPRRRVQKKTTGLLRIFRQGAA
ncbi:MAG: hypothetical protein D6731_02275 [Planctomycetota bacterium]|nr:MAG: hypothetical protein D6731_02275 [Planctomycetota bacterium]